MVDEFVDRIKGRRRVRHEGACEYVGDFYFNLDGTKWLCVASERDEHGLVLDIDEIEPIFLSKVLRKSAAWFFGAVLTVGSIAAPVYWFLWGNP